MVTLEECEKYYRCVVLHEDPKHPFSLDMLDRGMIQHIYDKQQETTERPPAIDIQRFERAPCYLCGYGGGGYYQPAAHPCANAYHKAVEEGPPA